MNQGRTWGFRLALAVGTATVLLALPTGASAQSSVEELGPTGELPEGLVVDSAGNVYTADSGSNTVTKIGTSGRTTSFGPTGNGPVDLVIDSAGNIFTVNLYAGNVSKILPNGAVIADWAPTGLRPSSIAIGPSDYLYVANSGSSSVTRISPAGTSSGVAPDYVWARTDAEPSGIVVDPYGVVYTSNVIGTPDVSGTISRILPDGTSDLKWAGTGRRPYSLAIGYSGGEQVLYTANYGGNTVSRIDPSGKTVREWGATGQFPTDIVVGPQGQVFVVNSWSASVSVFHPQKGFLRTLEPTGRSPNSAAFDRDGNLLVTNRLDSTVSRFTPWCLSGAYARARGNLSCSAPKLSGVKWTRARSEFPGKRKITVWFSPRRGVSYKLLASRGGTRKEIKCGHSGWCSTVVGKGVWRIVLVPTRSGVRGSGAGKTFKIGA